MAASLSPSQAHYAAQIISIGKSRSNQGAVDYQIALMVALDESDLQNLANSNVPESLNYPHDGVGKDHNSLGLFQQQTPQWGTVAELMDPATQITKFYDALGQVGGRGHLPLWTQAQAVQHSATSDGSNYKAKMQEAADILAGLGENVNSQNPINSAGGSLTALLTWLGNGKNWVRVGLFALGAALLALVLWELVKDTAAVKDAAKLGAAAVAL